MPRTLSTSNRKRPVIVKRSPSADILSDSMEEEKPLVPTKRKVWQKNEEFPKATKIAKAETHDNPCTSLATFTDFGNEMNKLFSSLGSTMQNSLRSKKKRLEEFTADALKINQTKISQLCQTQSENRKQLLQKLHQNAKSIFEEWECDLVNTKEEEKKMIKTIHQYFRTLKEQRNSRAEKLDVLRKEYEGFFEAIYEQENKYAEEYKTIGKELEKDLFALQNKMMLKTQQDEMLTMENSLKSVLFI